ncbi:hypothetical protein ABW21_db0204652 [Orbilia brochopaga]|nr:hypothetical protein ABW21_db0204652 [Drechslerella brochopaga]
MKVKIKEWHAVATWRWDMPEDEVCGICRVDFDGCCPNCKYPGDDCPLSTHDDAQLLKFQDHEVETVNRRRTNRRRARQLRRAGEQQAADERDDAIDMETDLIADEFERVNARQERLRTLFRETGQFGGVQDRQ